MEEFVPLKAEKIKKVRKDHSCSWCGEPILVGTSAVYRAYMYEGEFKTEYQHPECFESMAKDGDGEFEIGMFKRGTCEIK